MSNILAGRRVEVFGSGSPEKVVPFSDRFDNKKDDLVKIYEGTFVDFSHEDFGGTAAIVMDDDGNLKSHAIQRVKIADSEHLLCALASQQMHC